MRIHNTLGRVTGPFEPAGDGPIRVYLCGPTVQSPPHVGHGRSAVAFDVVRRYLMWKGHDVTFVRNITDVEDKIIAAAAEEGIDSEVLAARVAGSFEAAHDALGVLPPDVEPKATEHIPEMIRMITTLIENGVAYAVDGDVYFAVRSDPDYGKLSGRNIDDLLAGARVEPGEKKRDPLDFALWKAAKPGEPTWDSPWGPGRPGWHIECSAMARAYLGDTIDIHGGGSDLIFPHHENEIAQSEGATGHPFARYWLHNGMITLSGEKMAKSTGHIVGLLDVLDRYPPMAVRLFYLRAHYRSPLDYSTELLDEATAAYERLVAFRRRTAAVESVEPDRAVMDGFRAAMDDDFNTADALSVVFEAVREGNRRLDAGEDPAPIAAAVAETMAVLGLDLPTEDVADLGPALAAVAAGFGVEPTSAAETIDALVASRAEARARRDWAAADAIRDALAKIGVIMEDTADGVRWHRQ